MTPPAYPAPLPSGCGPPPPRRWPSWPAHTGRIPGRSGNFLPQSCPPGTGAPQNRPRRCLRPRSGQRRYPRHLPRSPPSGQRRRPKPPHRPPTSEGAGRTGSKRSVVSSWDTLLFIHSIRLDASNGKKFPVLPKFLLKSARTPTTGRTIVDKIPCVCHNMSRKFNMFPSRGV